MNKKLVFFSLIFMTLFCFKTNVFASSVKVGINYDANEHFNYFYEQKNNTGFYQFLQEHRLDFEEHMRKYKTSFSSYADHYFIYYAKDLEKYLLQDYSFPENAKYVILAVDYSMTYDYISHYNNKYGYGYGENFVFNSPNASSTTNLYGHSLIFFNDDGEYIDCTESVILDNIKNFYFEIEGTTEDSSAEFTYFLSNLFYFQSYSVKSYNFLYDIIVTDIYFDNNHYIIDDNENYSSFNIWFRTFFTSAEKYDISNTQLNYFRENKYFEYNGSFISLFDIIQQDSNMAIPDGYISIDLKGANNYLFIPKSIDNNLLNRDFYTYLPDYVETENAKIGANIIDLKSGSYSYIGLSDDESEKKRIYELSLKKPFTLYSINFSSILNKYNSDKPYTDYAFVFVNRWAKTTPILYYNSESYSVCVYKDSSSSCSYTNPYTGDSVKLTGEEFYKIVSQVDSTGASIDIFDDADTQRETASKYSELYEYDDDGNITGFSLSNVLKSLSSFLSNIISVISVIFTYFTKFFNALPVEIRGLLYFGLIGGIILLFWKLIK